MKTEADPIPEPQKSMRQDRPTRQAVRHSAFRDCFKTCFIESDEMATTLGDLVRDVESSKKQKQDAETMLKACEKRLIDALLVAGIPLSVKSSVVIGTTLVKRPYETLGLELVEIENVSPNLAVE